MGWKQWVAVVVLIGGGIMLQIPGHDDTVTNHLGMSPEGLSPDASALEGPLRTVNLEVTGMT
jgi:hypothetical protein